MRRMTQIFYRPIVFPLWVYIGILALMANLMFGDNPVIGILTVLIGMVVVVISFLSFVWRVKNKLPMHYVVMYSLTEEAQQHPFPTAHVKVINLNAVGDDPERFEIPR